MKAIRKAVASVPGLFGYAVLALVISTASCRFNKLQAQDEDGVVVKTNWCNQAYYEATYGADWHLYWALHMCWLYTENAAPTAQTSKPWPRQFMVRGR